MSELTDRGRATRKRVLGAEPVTRSETGATPLEAPFEALITDAARGHVWSRDTLPLRKGWMATIALLARPGNREELALHIRGSANTGTTEADVMEVLRHAAVYAGVPRAKSAMRVARDSFAEIQSDTTGA
jgi:4-carboxymuconolactone decarboxylase